MIKNRVKKFSALLCFFVSVALFLVVLLAVFFIWRGQVLVDKNISQGELERLRPSMISRAADNQKFPANIAAYIEFYRRAIIDLHLASPIKVTVRDSLLKAPFYHAAEDNPACVDAFPRRGILLVHGLSDSPYFMRAMGRFFYRQCFSVFAIVLPGHATRPGDLLDVSYRDWIRAVEHGLLLLSEQVDSVQAAGFSAGATALLASPTVLEKAQALWLFSPALKLEYSARFAAIAPYFSGLGRGARWHQILPGDDPYKYTSFPLFSVAQAAALVRRARENLKVHRGPLPPLFVAASGEDDTVDITGSLEVFNHWPQTLKNMVLYAPVSIAENKKTELLSDSALWVETWSDGDSHLLGLSHPAIVIPPSDPVYGVSRWYRDCRYYYRRHDQAYRQCKAGRADFLGELMPSNLQRGVIERLRYNPQWTNMLNHMRHFLSRLNERSIS